MNAVELKRKSGDVLEVLEMGKSIGGGESVSINVRGKDKKRSYRCAIMLSCKCHNDNGRALSTAATTLFKLWPLLV